MKRLGVTGVVIAVLAGVLGLFAVQTAGAKTLDKPLPRVVVYVESQDLCYDSIITAQDLPNAGPFQVLEPDPDNNCGGDPASALKTVFGPGDTGYVGGRWVLGSMYFSCPLLGPGYPPA